MKKAIIPITRNSNKENSQTGILVVSVTSKKSIPGNEILSNKLTLSRLISNDIRVAAPININMTPKNLEKIFKIAYEKGIILTGVSAGAVCWFDWILSDSMGRGFEPLKGINLVEGSCTPHSDNIERINEFGFNIKNNKLNELI